MIKCLLLLNVKLNGIIAVASSVDGSLRECGSVYLMQKEIQALELKEPEGFSKFHNNSENPV